MTIETAPDNTPCHCGSGLTLANCCMPAITGATPAGSAEALMRSRYTAYVLGNRDYLSASWHPSTRPPQLELNPGVAWLGLTVVSRKAGLAEDAKGSVEFIARYQMQGVPGQVHENSRFVQEQGMWFYLDGDLKTATTVGRNDPCPCGSGKKFKKCCGK